MNPESGRHPGTAPGSPSVPPAPSGAIVTRRVATLDEYEQCVAIQEETWGAGFSERVPSSILLVSQRVGGVVAGAFADDGRMLGFVFGLTGVRDGHLEHWSDMLAVRPAARGAGIGERLKRCQRDLVRAIGVGIMRWTFDPLVARNAHLNLTRLGARAAEYVPNMYGSNTGSPLHGGIPTDRIVATWDLTRDDAPLAHPSPRPGPLLNPPGADGLPTVGASVDAPVVHVAIPDDVFSLPRAHRAAWRSVTRTLFLDYLQRGYRIAGFHRDAPTPFYELVHRDADGAA